MIKKRKNKTNKTNKTTKQIKYLTESFTIRAFPKCKERQVKKTPKGFRYTFRTKEHPARHFRCKCRELKHPHLHGDRTVPAPYMSHRFVHMSLTAQKDKRTKRTRDMDD
jgi:hypothetical protein